MDRKFDEMVENQQIVLGTMGRNRPNLDLLEEAVKEFREMLAAKNPAKDDLFAGLPRVKATIIMEAVMLVESELWESILTLQK